MLIIYIEKQFKSHFFFDLWDFQVNKGILISVGFQQNLRYTFDRIHLINDFRQNYITIYKINNQLW